MKDNNYLELWQHVSKTDPKHTKEVGYGSHKFTAINAAYQIRQATKYFGLYGETWGIKSIEYTQIKGLANNIILMLGNAVFFHPTGEFPISSSIELQSYSKKYDTNSVDSDFAKKLETDITTKALSKLGFNADVFLGMYDDNKYVNKMRQEFAANDQVANEKKQLNIISKIDNVKGLTDFKAKYHVKKGTPVFTALIAKHKELTNGK